MLMPAAVATWHRALTHQVPWGWADVRDYHEAAKIVRRDPKTKIVYDEIMRHDRMTGDQLRAILRAHNMSNTCQKLINGSARCGLIKVAYQKVNGGQSVVSLEVVRPIPYCDYLSEARRKPGDQALRDAIRLSKLRPMRAGETFTVADIGHTYKARHWYARRLTEVGAAVVVRDSTPRLYKALVDIPDPQVG